MIFVHPLQYGSVETTLGLQERELVPQVGAQHQEKILLCVGGGRGRGQCSQKYQRVPGKGAGTPSIKEIYAVIQKWRVQEEI